MYDKPETKPPVPWSLIAVILVIAGAAVYFVINELSDNSPREKSRVAAVTLVKPPLNPPSKPPLSVRPKEKASGIERVPKEEDSSNQGMQVEGKVLGKAGAQDGTRAADSRGAHVEGGGRGGSDAPGVEGGGKESSDAPAGDTLGMDVEGGAGGDSFGLVGRKGGRSILAKVGSPKGGGSSKWDGTVPLLTKFAGYINIMTAEIKEQVVKRLDAEGGIPQGNLQCIIRVSIDKNGKIISHRITSTSGNIGMDQAIMNALRSYRFRARPPESMPRTMDIMVT
ncbi:MAG TPA: TonB family protein, partial [Thermodesulfovibrionales bacterium]|nr:TonB family protein [Thermodesulfovibrionales bacterium]